MGCRSNFCGLIHERRLLLVVASHVAHSFKKGVQQWKCNGCVAGEELPIA